MSGGGEFGPSWFELEHAARVLRAQGHESVAFALEGLLGGSDPRDEISRARLSSERMEHRDRMLGELYLAAFADLSPGQAGRAIADAWARYEAREAAIDRRSGSLPRSLLLPGARGGIERSYFARLAALGFRALGARQISNVLSGPSFGLVLAFAEELRAPTSRRHRASRCTRAVMLCNS